MLFVKWGSMELTHSLVCVMGYFSHQFIFNELNALSKPRRGLRGFLSLKISEISNYFQEACFASRSNWWLCINTDLRDIFCDS